MMIAIGLVIMIANLVCVKVNLDANNPMWMANAAAAVVVGIMVGNLIAQL